MIGLFGKCALALACFFCLLQSILPLWGHFRANPYALAFARPCVYGQFVFLLIAYFLLTFAFAVNDFSLSYVAANSHFNLPILYRLAAVWGAHEGSILLWVMLLSCWTVVFTYFQPSESLVIALLGLISLGLSVFLIFTSNPFLAAPFLQTASDLNPLLQDPGLFIHPPMLYLGYVGLAIPFALTQAALMSNKLDQQWSRLTKRYTLFAWCFLTLGITLGSLWAYRVLGWGGFWFWDPVENASLLPWLSATALIHVLHLVEKKERAKSWAAFLTILCFGLSLLGTFLVRSGILISSHSFANDPARALFLLGLLAILLTAALIIYLIKRPLSPDTPDRAFFLLSKETGLLLNSILFFVATLTILMATLYPLILDAFHLGAVSIGAPYFTQVMTPLVWLALFLMGSISFCSFGKKQTLQSFCQLTWKKGCISVVGAMGLLYLLSDQLSFTAFISLSLSLWVIISLLDLLDPARTMFLRLPAMSLAHSGFALFIIGILFSALLCKEREVSIKPGDQVSLGPYQFYFLNTKIMKSSNYDAIRATFRVMKNHREITYLFPEKRRYPVRDMVMTKVAIHPSLFRDLYVALGDPLDENHFSVRMHYKPCIRFIWIGGGMMMISGLLAILGRRKQALTRRDARRPLPQAGEVNDCRSAVDLSCERER